MKARVPQIYLEVCSTKSQKLEFLTCFALIFLRLLHLRLRINQYHFVNHIGSICLIMSFIWSLSSWPFHLFGQVYGVIILVMEFGWSGLKFIPIHRPSGMFHLILYPRAYWFILRQGLIWFNCLIRWWIILIQSSISFDSYISMSFAKFICKVHYLN